MLLSYTASTYTLLPNNTYLYIAKEWTSSTSWLNSLLIYRCSSAPFFVCLLSTSFAFLWISVFHTLLFHLITLMRCFYETFTILYSNKFNWNWVYIMHLIYCRLFINWILLKQVKTVDFCCFWIEIQKKFSAHILPLKNTPHTAVFIVFSLSIIVSVCFP